MKVTAQGLRLALWYVVRVIGQLHSKHLLCFCFVFETSSHYVIQAGLKLIMIAQDNLEFGILLPLLL